MDDKAMEASLLKAYAKRLPLFLRTGAGKRLTDAQLQKLAELFRKQQNGSKS